MSDPDVNDEVDAAADRRARSALVILLVSSIVVGAVLGIRKYGSIEDARSWNMVGLVMITFVFTYGLIVGARSWWCGPPRK